MTRYKNAFLLLDREDGEVIVKVTANYIMYQHYSSAGIYDNMTDEQWAAVEKWKERWL